MISDSARKPIVPMRVPMATIVVTVFLGVYWVALFYATHTKLPPGLLPGSSDKFVHFAAYAGLGLLLMSLRAIHGAYSWAGVFRRWLFLAGYGAFDELTQMLVNRTADVHDWLADVSGAACGLGLVTFAVWRISRSAGPVDEDPAANSAPS